MHPAPDFSGLELHNIAARRTAAYRDILAALSAEFSARSVHLLDGHELLPGTDGLTCDLVHPSTEGHTVLAENLAARLRALAVC